MELSGNYGQSCYPSGCLLQHPNTASVDYSCVCHRYDGSKGAGHVNLSMDFFPLEDLWFGSLTAARWCYFGDLGWKDEVLHPLQHILLVMAYVPSHKLSFRDLTPPRRWEQIIHSTTTSFNPNTPFTFTQPHIQPA